MFIKLIVTSPVYSFLVCPEQVTTNWEAYTHKHVFSHSSGSLKCKIKVLAGSHSLPRLLGRLLVLCLPALVTVSIPWLVAICHVLCVFTWLPFSLCLLFLEGYLSLNLGSIWIIQINTLNLHYKDPFSK